MISAACLGLRPAWGLRPPGRGPGLVLCLLAVWLACASSAAWANWDSQKPVLLERQGNSMTFIAGPQTGGAVANRTATFGATVSVSDQVHGPGRTVGSTFTYTARRTLTAAAVGKAIARSLPLVSTAVAVGELLATIRCDEGFGALVECDDGQPEITETIFCTTWATNPSGPAVRGCGTSPMAAINDIRGKIQVWPAMCERYIISEEPNKYAEVQIWRNQYTQACEGQLNPPWAFVQPGTPMQRCPGEESAHPFYPGECTKQRSGWISTDFDTVEGIIEDHGNLPGRLPTIVPELLERGVPIEHPAPTVDLPPATGWERETSTAPDGTITTRDARDVPEGRPDGWDWRREERTTIYPPNTVPDPIPVGTPGPGSGTGTSGGSSSAPAAEPPITCGLPDTPPCKIDEGGTPPPVSPGDFGMPADADPVGSLRGIIENPEVAELDFTWAFTLPTGCSTIDLGNWAGRDMVFDLCPHQPMIHDLVSMLWVGFGIWGAFGLISRAFSGG